MLTASLWQYIAMCLRTMHNNTWCHSKLSCIVFDCHVLLCIVYTFKGIVLQVWRDSRTPSQVELTGSYFRSDLIARLLVRQSQPASKIDCRHHATIELSCRGDWKWWVNSGTRRGRYNWSGQLSPPKLHGKNPQNCLGGASVQRLSDIIICN